MGWYFLKSSPEDMVLMGEREREKGRGRERCGRGALILLGCLPYVLQVGIEPAM